MDREPESKKPNSLLLGDLDLRRQDQSRARCRAAFTKRFKRRRSNTDWPQTTANLEYTDSYAALAGDVRIG